MNSSYSRQFAARLFLFSVLCTAMLSFGCGGSTPSTPTAAVPGLSPEAHERKGLELAEKRDYEGALVELKAAQEGEPTAVRRLGIAHLLYMQKKYSEAVESYQAYLASTPHLPKSQRAKLSDEIARISAALDGGGEPTGRSLAGQWLRGRLAWLRAEEARKKGDLKIAIANFDKAFQYSGDPEMLFEEALVATEAADLHTAVKKFGEYLSIGRNDIKSDRIYRVNAEVDRLQTILDGEVPVTDESLAQQIYAERSGERAPEERAPSVVKELEEEKAALADGSIDEEIEAAAKKAEEGRAKAQAQAAKRAKRAEEEREKALLAAKEKEEREHRLAEEKAEKERRKEEAAAKREAEAEAREAARLAALEEARLEKERKKAEREAAEEKRAEERERKRQEALAKKKELEEARKAKREAKIAAKKAEKERKKAEREAKLAAKKAEKERKRAEREAKIAAKKAEKERKKAEKAAAATGEGTDAPDDWPEAPEVSVAADVPESQGASGSGLKGSRWGAAPVSEGKSSKPRKTSMEDLVFYSRSNSSSVRYRAVKDLTPLRDDRARQVLEERVTKDTNRQVRYAAIEGLVARGSRISVPVLRRARITAATSEERAVLRDAIERLNGLR